MSPRSQIKWLLVIVALIALFLIRERRRAATGPAAKPAETIAAADRALALTSREPLSLREPLAPLPAEEQIPAPRCLPGLSGFDQPLRYTHTRAGGRFCQISSDAWKWMLCFARFGIGVTIA